MSRPAEIVAGIVSGTVVLSALGVGALVLMSPKPAWFVLGFEAATLAGAVMGVLTGMGRFRAGPATALLCAGGTVVAASYLGSVAARGSFDQGAIDAALIGRVIAAGVLGAAAAWTAVSGSARRSVPRLGLGVVLLGGALGMVAAGWMFRNSLTGLPGVLGSVFGFLAVTGLLAAGVEMVMRAFAREVVE